MNITGTHYGTDSYQSDATGCFYLVGPNNHLGNKGSDMDNLLVGFDAARAWTGETSSNGNHSHSVNVSISAQGGNREHTHPLTATGSTGSFLIVPTHLKFAYFVRVPEVAS